MSTIKTKLINIYEGYVRPSLYTIREWWPLWFYVLNFPARRHFAQYPVVLSPLQKKLVDALKKEGIATTTLDELFPGEQTLSRLRTHVETQPPVPDELKRMKKQFQRRLWETTPVFDLTNPFVDIATRAIVFDIANSYMEMWTKLNYYDLARTLPIEEHTPAQNSQHWHRDNEEKRMCKMFVYLSDVDEGSGPFTYIPGSVYGMKPYGHLFPQRPPEGSYPGDDLVLKTIPEDAIRSMKAPAGTVIFCDTSGIHMGGYATKKERLMYTVFYPSPRWSDRKYYRIDGDIPTNLPPQVRYALT